MSGVLLWSLYHFRCLETLTTQVGVSKSLVHRIVRFFCPQNIAEFWHVATPPVAVNGLGFTHEEVLSEVQNIEGLLTLLPDSPAIYAEWKRLVTEHKMQGVKVFDARLIAVANAYGVGSNLIFNAADFQALRRHRRA